MNPYYKNTKDFQDKLKDYANSIFKAYGKELVLRLEEYNLLQNKHNCIESSTAIGFILEEFLVSKLEMFTHCDEDSDYIIDRFVGATASESFDCFSIKGNMKFMVNVKAEKNGSSANDAVAAIEQLHRNYCQEEADKEKCFILFKIKYSIRDAYEDDEHRRAKPRHLYIDNLETYNIESVDFSNEWSQDNRSWSEKANGHRTKNNGRLKISPAFRRDHKVPEADISFINTCRQLDRIWHLNEECWQSTEDMIKYVESNEGKEIIYHKYDDFFNPIVEYRITYLAETGFKIISDNKEEIYNKESIGDEFRESLWELQEV